MAPWSSTTLALILFVVTASFAIPLQPHVRVDERLARANLDMVFIDTPGTPQDLCGDSTFNVADHNGPLRIDCEYLMNTTKRNPDGFWMASKFGSDGRTWVEFTRLRTCGIEVRRTDGEGGDVPFGDEDVVDLVNSALADFTSGERLPTVQGQMTCSKDGSRAAVEWQIFRT